MAYTVTITYTGVSKDVETAVAPISSIFVPTSSYIDTPVYVEGYHNSSTGGTVADKYGKSIYATNVPGDVGLMPQVEPFASTSIPYPVPLAQFKLAVVGTNNTATFTVEDYKEAFYYMTLGEQMKDQGFTIAVEEVTEEPSTPGTGS